MPGFSGVLATVLASEAKSDFPTLFRFGRAAGECTNGELMEDEMLDENVVPNERGVRPLSVSTTRCRND